MEASVSKVVIVGAGAVGSAIAFGLVTKGVVGEVVLLDVNKQKAQGEVWDLQHSLDFQSRNTKIKTGSYEECKNADIVILTAAAPLNGETNRMLMQEKSESILKNIVPEIMAVGFDGIFLVVSNPVDVMAYLVWKLSGLPHARVIGTGTILESARLKQLIGEIVDMDPRSIDACVMGEHGDSMMVPWSHIRAGGKNFTSILKDNVERFKEINLDDVREQTKKAGFNVLTSKGNTQYGIASAVTHIVTTIINNENRLIPISAYLDGEYGIKDVYCGVPAIVNRRGVKEIGNFNLEESEKINLIQSVEFIKESIGKLKIGEKV